jgi:hypothetical protein
MRKESGEKIVCVEEKLLQVAAGALASLVSAR